ncbi:MAG: nucleotide sugar dehydrogenase, partial [Anaerolineae bacterium]|nr:nucleotide sugar dehydrogenase [Anaerolineae bacterium]
MKIIVAGTGFVGLAHAAVVSEYGHEVYAYDIDEKKIAAYQSADPDRIEHYVNEPGLSAIIAENLNRYLFFTTDIESIIEGTDAIFLCLPTPPNPNGSSDLSFYFNALEYIAELLAKRKDQRRVVLINKSTVPIGTARRLEAVLQKHGVPNAGVASNPEFLPEGDAVEKSRRPDRVVVGADTEEDFRIMRRIYSQFVNHVRIRYIETTPETAESIKYVANTLLLTYISFWNGVGARLGENFNNIRMEDLKRGVTADNRISTWGSYVSNGAGGSCFGKDVQSLIYQLKSANQPADLLESVYHINEYQKTYLVDRAIHEAGVSFNHKTVALLGLAFKQRTNDMRDASSLAVVDALLSKGVQSIRAYDPLAASEAKRFFDPAKNHLFEKISYHD